MSNCIFVADPQPGQLVPIYGQEIIANTRYTLDKKIRWPASEVFATVIYYCRPTPADEAGVCHGRLTIFHLGEVSEEEDRSASLRIPGDWLNLCSRELPGRRLEVVSPTQLQFRAGDELLDRAYSGWNEDGFERSGDYSVDVVTVEKWLPESGTPPPDGPYFTQWPSSDPKLAEQLAQAYGSIPFVKLELHNLPLDGNPFKALRLRFYTNAGIQADPLLGSISIPVEGPKRMIDHFNARVGTVPPAELREAMLDVLSVLNKQPLVPLQYDILLVAPELDGIILPDTNPPCEKHFVAMDDSRCEASGCPVYTWPTVSDDFHIEVSGKFSLRSRPTLRIEDTFDSRQHRQHFLLWDEGTPRAYLQADRYETGTWSVYWPTEFAADRFCETVAGLMARFQVNPRGTQLELRGVRNTWRIAVPDWDKVPALVAEGSQQLGEEIRIARFDTPEGGFALAPRPGEFGSQRFVGCITSGQPRADLVAAAYHTTFLVALDAAQIEACLGEIYELASRQPPIPPLPEPIPAGKTPSSG